MESIYAFPPFTQSVSRTRLSLQAISNIFCCELDTAGRCFFVFPDFYIQEKPCLRRAFHIFSFNGVPPCRPAVMPAGLPAKASWPASKIACRNHYITTGKKLCQSIPALYWDKPFAFTAAGLLFLLHIVRIHRNGPYLFALKPVADKGLEQAQDGDDQEHAGCRPHEEIAEAIFRVGKSLSQVALQHRPENESQEERRPVQA